MYIVTDILSHPMNRLGEYVHTYVYLFCIVCFDAVFNYTYCMLQLYVYMLEVLMCSFPCFRGE